MKREKKLQKPYLTNQNLLTAQDLWQAHYQILLIILLRKFIKLNTKMNRQKKCEAFGIKDKDCECCLIYANVKDDLLLCKFLCCNRNYRKKFDESSRKRFANTCTFSNHDIHKFISMLQKGLKNHPHEYMGDWEKLNETSSSEKKDFYRHLNIEDITDADYMHPKRVFKDFEIKQLDEYHYLCVQGDTLLLADVFNRFWNMS